MNTTTTPALAWVMHAPSSSGGKAWKVLVVDNLMVTGWGSMSSGSRQYSVKRYLAPEGARAAAAEQTAAKESKGYWLNVQPYTINVSAKDLNIIRAHKRGGSMVLDRIF